MNPSFYQKAWRHKVSDSCQGTQFTCALRVICERQHLLEYLFLSISKHVTPGEECEQILDVLREYALLKRESTLFPHALLLEFKSEILPPPPPRFIILDTKSL